MSRAQPPPDRSSFPAKSTISRRAVLGAAAAIAVPYFVSSIALGRARRRFADGAEDSIAAANDRISIGFIGVGNMGGGHVDNFLGRSSVQIVAICDVDQSKREAAAKRVNEHYAGQRGSAAAGGCATYNNFEDLLARDDIDAVLIAVPDHWHAIVAIAACEAGKDVYCEKPLALTVFEAQEMARAARRYDRVFQTGSQQRSDAKFRFACEAVRSGRIGKLLEVHVGIGGPSHEKVLPAQPVRAGFDWNRWLGPAPEKPYSEERSSGSYSGGWRHIRDYSGGMMTDWGAHHIDIAQWGMGMDGGGPIEIIPPAGQPPTINQKPKPGEGVMWKYANGVTLHHRDANGVLFVGTDGKIEVNRGYLKSWPEVIEKTPIGPNETRLYESGDHVGNWLDCLRSRRRPIADVEIGCSSVTVCHLGNIAYWIGRPIRWNPEKREIVDDSYAARWLRRPMRAPWRLWENPRSSV